MDTKKKKRLGLDATIFILFVFLLLQSACFVYWHEFEVPAEKVIEINVGSDTIQKGSLKWFSIRDESFNGFYTPEILLQYGVNPETLSLDLGKNTYIITCGHSLENIKFTFSRMKNRGFLFLPKQLIGIVTLSIEQTPNLYVYKIPKMDIDCDYHSPDRFVLFTNEAR